MSEHKFTVRTVTPEDWRQMISVDSLPVLTMRLPDGEVLPKVSMTPASVKALDGIFRAGPIGTGSVESMRDAPKQECIDPLAGKTLAELNAAYDAKVGRTKPMTLAELAKRMNGIRGINLDAAIDAYANEIMRDYVPAPRTWRDPFREIGQRLAGAWRVLRRHALCSRGVNDELSCAQGPAASCRPATATQPADGRQCLRRTIRCAGERGRDCCRRSGRIWRHSEDQPAGCAGGADRD